MKLVGLFALLALTCESLVVQKRLATPESKNNGYFKIDFEVAERDPSDPTRVVKRSEMGGRSTNYEALAKRSRQQLHKRSGNSSSVNDAMTIYNNRTVEYYANISLGTPPQNFSVQMDTGSSDLWIFAKSNPYCNFGSSSSKRDLDEKDWNYDGAMSSLEAGIISINNDAYTATDGEFSTIDDNTATAISSATIFSVTSSATKVSSATLGTTTASASVSVTKTSSASASGGSKTSSVSASGTKTSSATSVTITASAATSGTTTLASSGDFESINRITYITPSYNSEQATLSIDTATVEPTIACDDSGYFNPDDSSSFHETDNTFVIGYGDYTFAQGTVNQDTLVFNDFVIENYTFGLATAANSSEMVFGIGLQGDETLGLYDNFPLRLVDSGYINRAVYSLYLNDFNATSGSILFGAVDSSKYTGALTTFQLINIYPQEYTNPTFFYITCDSIDLTYASNSSVALNVSSAKHPILFDSGTSVFQVPPTVYEWIGVAFEQISYIEEVGGYIANCNALKEYNFDFTFQGVTYSIPLSFFGTSMTQATEIFLGAVDLKYNKADYCFLNILPNDEGVMIAGDTLLRWFYVVYDLTNYEILLAQAVFDNSAEDIHVVSALGKIPGAVSAADSGMYEFTDGSPSASDGEEPTFTGSTPTGTKNLNAGGKLTISWSLIAGALAGWYFIL